MKKALIVTEVFFPEDFIINDLAREWAKQGYEFEVLTRNPSYPYGKVYKGYRNRPYQKDTFEGKQVNRIYTIPGYQKSTFIKILNYFNYVFWSFWFVLFKGRKYDKIFFYQTGPLTNILSFVWFRRLFNFKITIWTQDLWPETLFAYGIPENKITKWMSLLLVKYIYKRCHCILVSCKGFIPKIKQYGVKIDPVWIPNWSLIQSKVDVHISLNNGYNFTFTGNIGKVQNLDNVIRAFAPINHEFKNAYLNIVGDGSYLESLKQLVQEEQITNVHFTGRKPLYEMSGYFEASDVLIISLVDAPIYRLTIPSKFQAYLTASKPIFCVMDGEVSDLVSENQLGYTATPSDINAITNGYRLFLNNRTKDTFSKNAKDLLTTSFNRNSRVKQLTHLFWR